MSDSCSCRRHAIEMNYIGTTKTINQDILNISKVIEVKVDKDMMQHKLNASKGDFEHLKNNEELNEIINQLYNSDMKIFQYISKNKDIMGNNFKGMNYKGMLIDRPIY
jgi:PKD repeat protein